MPDLLVTEGELKSEYQAKAELWDKVYRRIFTAYAKLRWRHNPLIAYPLAIDIHLGMMKYYYFKKGLFFVKFRIDNYKILFMARLEGRDFDLNPDDFYIQTVLTDEDSINEQLDKEIIELDKY